MKNRLQGNNINLSRPKRGRKYSKYKNHLSMTMLLYVLSNTEATYKAQFMEKLSNTEAELKRSAAFKKSV